VDLQSFKASTFQRRRQTAQVAHHMIDTLSPCLPSNLAGYLPCVAYHRISNLISLHLHHARPGSLRQFPGCGRSSCIHGAGVYSACTCHHVLHPCPQQGESEAFCGSISFHWSQIRCGQPILSVGPLESNGAIFEMTEWAW
jgi:hypothetical protein